MTASRRSQAGFTMIEVAVVTVIFAVTFAIFGQVFSTSDNLVSESRAHLRAHEDLRRNLEMLANVLRGVDIDTLGGFVDGEATAPSFRRITGADLYGRTYSDTETLQWEAVNVSVNGVDNPGRVVSVQGLNRTLVADRVPLGGFRVTLQGSAILITLSTYASTSDPRVVTVTGDTAVVSLRN
jgi:prepilin-type N-terminal cleavage/methylation domain-containing protein